MRQSNNPVFRNMQKQGTTYVEVGAETASWSGITTKTLFLVLLTIVAGISSWFIPIQALIPLVFVGAFGSFILVFFAMMKPKAAKVLSIIYAILQGITYGTLTLIVDQLLLPGMGIGLIALVATFSIVGVMAFLHGIGAVRATPFLRRFVLGALISILLGSLVMLILNFAAPAVVAGLAGNYPLMVILYSGLVLLGAFMLIIDFDNAKQLVENGAPKMYEWQVGLGILVTVVWIYLQILRLLIIIFGNRR